MSNNIESLTKATYLQEVTEENNDFVHVRLEKKQFVTDENGDPVKVSKPFIQLYGKKNFSANKMADRLKRQGYQVTVLYDANKDKKAWADAHAPKAEKPAAKK